MFKYTRKKTSINGQKAKTKHGKSPVASASCPVSVGTTCLSLSEIGLAH